MTRPAPRSGARPSPAVAAAMAGAVDLSALKARADAKTAAQQPADGASAASVVVTEANFEAEVLQRSSELPVIVALVSPRSPASLELARTLERLALADAGRWVLAAVEADSNLRIAQAFGVQTIPAVVAVAAGQPLADMPPTQDEAQIRQWIDAVLAAVAGKLTGAATPEAAEPAEDPRFTAAEDALGNGDYAGAAAAYEAILSAEPGNSEAQAALRQVRFLTRTQDVAPTAVADADADPSSVTAQLAAADAELLAQDPGAAFERLIGTIKRTSGDDRTAARTRLLELFELFDPADPLVVAARRKLAVALY